MRNENEKWANFKQNRKIQQNVRNLSRRQVGVDNYLSTTTFRAVEVDNYLSTTCPTQGCEINFEPTIRNVHARERAIRATIDEIEFYEHTHRRKITRLSRWRRYKDKTREIKWRDLKNMRKTTSKSFKCRLDNILLFIFDFSQNLLSSLVWRTQPTSLPLQSNNHQIISTKSHYLGGAKLNIKPNDQEEKTWNILENSSKSTQIDSKSGRSPSYFPLSRIYLVL